MFSKFLSLIFLCAFATLTVMPARAQDKIIDYGDGIVMTEFEDLSGFKITGGGAEFTFHYKTQEMIVMQNQQQQVIKIEKSEASTEGQ
jgi:hypothetical protein